MTIPMSRDDYRRYLSSNKWRDKRSEAIAVSGYCCEKCGVSKWSVRLEVHHITYERLGEERLGDLMVLCRECHAEAHRWTGYDYLLDHLCDDLYREPPNTPIEYPQWVDYSRFDLAVTKKYGGNWSFMFTNSRINDLWNQWVSGYWP